MARVDVARNADVACVALVVALKVAIGLAVLKLGFSHVSDDDYARTVIAERFAHAPHLDPSGTSWLPLPFWLEGIAMAVAGRSLEVARVVAVLLGAMSTAAPYLAMRAVGVGRTPSLLATMIAMALPWDAWLGVATVPEGWTGAVVAAGAIAMGRDRSRPWAAAALLAGALSRYEAWPVCALAAATFAWSAWQRRRSPHERTRALAWGIVAAAGPILWMAWNAYAHGSPVHFVARVTAFRRAIGAADAPLVDKLLDYPTAFLNETPDVLALGVVGVAALAMRSVRARWGWALAGTLAMFVFLVWGDVRDGAPTHHPARALSPAWWTLVGAGVDGLLTFVASFAVGARRAGAAAIACATLAWLACLPHRWARAPGQSEWDRREAQIARGLDLRARGVAHVAITPCSFEHFALLAAWGAPERAAVADRTGAPPTAECPRVDER